MSRIFDKIKVTFNEHMSFVNVKKLMGTIRVIIVDKIMMNVRIDRYTYAICRFVAITKVV